MEQLRMDHFVLTVADVERACGFYGGILGMEVVTFGEGRKALRFGDQKINLHRQGAEFEPAARFPTPGSADLCFLVQTPLQEVIARLEEASVPIVEGPVPRTGSNGPILSVYCRDPDGNLIELANSL